MKAWRLLPLLAIVGCASHSTEGDVLAYRGPDVSIDVRPAGRAERFTAAPKPVVTKPVASPSDEVAQPDETAAKPKEESDEPKPKRRRRARPKPAEEAPKPKPKVEKPKEEVLPPDEDFYPSQRKGDKGDPDDFDPGLYRVPDRHGRGGGDDGNGEGQ